MIRAGGILLVGPAGKALFLKRANNARDFAGYWDFPGGGLEGTETIEQCAKREAVEECGEILLKKGMLVGPLVQWTRTATRLSTTPNAITPAPDGPEVDFTTFVQRVSEEFIPKLDGEHTGYAWAPIDAAPQPLHPGCGIALSRFGMDELGVARSIAAGELVSPQRYENVWLFAIRITGTGSAYRHKLKEFVWRDPKLYMTEEFLQRCNGLPVIMEHPPGAILDTDEFQKRIVGTILLPYLKPDAEEVWGIAKIYDAAAADMMAKEQLSTSPSVMFRDPSVNSKLELESGQQLLIEGKPSLLDHIAICEQGVWDKGGAPRGVETAELAIGDSSMTPEEIAALVAKAVEGAVTKVRTELLASTARSDDDARRAADAHAGEQLDKVLKGVDSVMAKMDAFGKRMDAVEEKLNDDDDAKKKADDARRRDAEAYSCNDDDDDDDSRRRRHDAEETSLKEKLEKEGEAKETAADRAKKARKDAEERESAMIADKKKKKSDDDAKKKADADRLRNDADAFRAGIMKDVEKLIPKPLTDADFAAFAKAQEKADRVFQAFNDSAPRPMQGEDLLAYRRRLAVKLQAHSAIWKDVDLATITQDAAFTPIEGQIYQDALAAADSPASIPEGKLLERIQTDPTGRRISTFRGRHSFVRDFKSPVRSMIKKIRTNTAGM